MAKPVLLRILLGLLLLADTAYTFRQNLGKPLDGDIVPIVLPSPHYQKVLEDPFGFRAVAYDEHYAGPNRYFAHATLRWWYRDVYEAAAFLFPDKIERLYILSALFNTLTQLLLIFLLAVYITGHARFWQSSFLLAACLLMPLFQVHGMSDVIGIIDQAVSYSFFYAFPLALLLLYLLPFYLAFRNQRTVSSYFGAFAHVSWAALAVYLAFSGPLIAPLVMLTAGFAGLGWLAVNWPAIPDGKFRGVSSIAPATGFHFTWLTALSLYSFYLGTYNSESLVELPLAERYLKLLHGLGLVLTVKGALPCLIGWLLANALFARRAGIVVPPDLRRLLWMLAGLVFVYMILLPLGGYRSYRPLIIRYDTFMPVSLILFGLCGFTAWKLLYLMGGRIRGVYAILVTCLLLFFTLRDDPQFGDRDCQRQSLYRIRDAQEPVVYVGNACTELTWWAGYDTAGTRNISEMLYQWGVTDKYQAFGGEHN